MPRLCMIQHARRETFNEVALNDALMAIGQTLPRCILFEPDIPTDTDYHWAVVPAQLTGGVDADSLADLYLLWEAADEELTPCLRQYYREWDEDLNLVVWEFPVGVDLAGIVEMAHDELNAAEEQEEAEEDAARR